MDRRVTVLLVEDDRLAVKTVIRAFRANHFEHPLEVVSHGEQALAFLRKEPPYTDVATPGLILLDWHMPVMNGLEFLRVYRSDPGINATPVVILSTSAEQRDVTAACQLGVGGYLQKPATFSDLVTLVKTVDDYWSQCQLPVTAEPYARGLDGR